MRRKGITLFLCLLLFVTLIPTVFAYEALPRVVDNAGLLTAAERQLLEEKALALRDSYQMDVVIVTTSSLGGKSPRDFADDYFDRHGYGDGKDDSGTLFLVSMEEREWYLSTSGAAIGALKHNGVEKIGNIMVPYLAEGDYYAAFVAYLDALPAYFETADSSAPNLLLSLVLGVAAAAVSIFVMHSTMNTKKLQYSASSYLKDGTFHIRTHQDLFLYSSVSKTRRQQNSGGSGGSSAHRSSSGRSHGGGGGKF